MNRQEFLRKILYLSIPFFSCHLSKKKNPVRPNESQNTNVINKVPSYFNPIDTVIDSISEFK